MNLSTGSVLGGSGSVFGSGRSVFGSSFVGVSISFLGLWGVLSLAFVFDISNETTILIGMVGDSLDTAIGKVDNVGS